MSSSWSFGTQALISSAGQMMLTGGITLTGTQISISAGALALGGYMLFAKDNFVEYLKKGMSQNQKEKFQREIESLKKKEGRGGSDNLDRDILREIAQWIKKIFS